MFRKLFLAALALLVLPLASANAQVSVGVRVGGPYYRSYYRPYGSRQ
jgi:hypothetical protein